MLTRALIAAALLMLPSVAFAATPKHRHHHAARVTTATYRTPMVAHRAVPDLRASAHGRHAVHTRYAAGHRHLLTRGS